MAMMKRYPLILTALFIAGCQGDLSGQVFVVTRGGENVRLGLVPILVISEADINAHIGAKKAEGQREMEKLAATIETTKAAITQAEAAVSTAQKEEAAAKQACGSEMDRLGYYSASGCSPQVRSWEIYASKMDARNEAQWALDEYRTRLAALRAEGPMYESSAYFLRDLPAPLVQAKTDANGDFKVAISRFGRVALAATGSRNLMSGEEKYYWLVWVSLDGKSSKRILLSNDNVTTSMSPESVVGLTE